MEQYTFRQRHMLGCIVCMQTQTCIIIEVFNESARLWQPHLEVLGEVVDAAAQVLEPAQVERQLAGLLPRQLCCLQKHAQRV